MYFVGEVYIDSFHGKATFSAVEWYLLNRTAVPHFYSRLIIGYFNLHVHTCGCITLMTNVLITFRDSFEVPVP